MESGLYKVGQLEVGDHNSIYKGLFHPSHLFISSHL